MKILITAGNSSKAIRYLKAYENYFVFLADYGEVPHMQTEKYAFISLGALNKESAAHILLNKCLDLNVDCVMPLNDFEIEALRKSAVLFEEYGIKVFLPGQS